jgi:hypothetical protein
MNRDEVQHRLEEFMRRGQPHRAWDFARKVLETSADPALRRALKYRFLRTFLPSKLPASFWNERRQEEARRLGLKPPPLVLRVGVVAFPVVFPVPEAGCFIAASVRFSETSHDEFPNEREVDATARRAMAEALEAARRLTGEQRYFRVAIDKPFEEPVKGASCGLAVALAALSLIDDRGLGDTISATGEVTRELSVRPVSDVDRKSALRREARPLAQILCPTGHPAEDGLIPVSRLEDARDAAWKFLPQAMEEALAEFKHARMEDPDNRVIRFRGLGKIAKGSSQTSLPLLSFAVAPSLRDKREEQTESEAELRRQLRAPNLTPESRLDLERKLARLERRYWRSPREPDDVSGNFSFARALHRFRRFTVIGDPGAGKSLLTRLAFLACAEGETGRQARTLLGAGIWFKPDEAQAIESLRALLPVRLELGKFGETLATEGDLPIETFVRRQLRSEGARSALRDGLGELLREGRLFLLCDGLDEVREELRERVVDGMSVFVRTHPQVRILVTTRPHGHDPEVPDFHHTWLAPLDYWQQRTLMARLHRLVEAQRHPGPEGLRLARHRTNELLQAIENRSEWQELISNPLLLTLSSLAPTNAEGVPEHQVIVFEGLIQTILQEWRAALKRPSHEADHLLKAWHTVAFELVQKEQRYGVGRGNLLRMLSVDLGQSAPINAKAALNLALETGLVQESGTTIKFWHSTFAEFLAARFLAQQKGETERFLNSRLTPLTLKFAVALLDHEFDAHDECNAIARALLACDEEGERLLLRPGLRTVSAWHADGVRFGQDIRQRIWEAWLEVLEQGPPSPLWSDFGKFAEKAPSESLAPRLVARLAQVRDRRVEEIREGIARIVAPAAASEPTVRTACAQWLEAPSHSTLKLFGAFGLASVGDWRNEVIQTLGRFGMTRKLLPHSIRTLVRNSGDTVLERLRDLVHQRFPSEEQQGSSQERSVSEAQRQSEPRELRLSAACLLAVAEYWDDDVARVMRLALAGSAGAFREDELHAVMRFCASELAVREALLEWLGAGSALGDRARKIVLDVAPLFEDMPEKLLERTAKANSEGRRTLEELLVSLAEELHTLPELLVRWLNDEHSGDQQLCAARILLRLAPQDRRLHAALRRGMRARSEVDRASWAHLVMRLEEEELRHTALETLVQCARASDSRVREVVYGSSPMQLAWTLRTDRLESWLAIASERSVAAQARLDAVHAVERVDGFREQVVPILHDLLHADDEEVRHSAAKSLAWREVLSPEAAVILAEEAVRGSKESYSRLTILRKLSPLSALMVRTILKELSRGLPSGDPQDPRKDALYWSFMLKELAEADLSCVNDLLRALEQPGVAGKTSQLVLEDLLDKHAAVRGALRQALRQALTAESHIRQFRLVLLGLEKEETRPAAIELSRAMAPASLTPVRSDKLAHKLHGAGEEHAAAQLWRRALENTEPDLVLDAAAMLIHHFPEEAPAWVQEGLQRVLSSPVASHQLSAGRFALLFGVYEVPGLAALVGCLNKPEESSWTRDGGWFQGLSFSRYRERHPDDEVRLEQVLHHHLRIDFKAMFELCAHRPDVGLPRLAAWLDDEELHRFSAAVKLLARKEEYRKRVGTALEQRLLSEPAGTLHIFIELIEKYGFYSRRMVEQLITRDDIGDPADHHTDWALTNWLQKRPELWVVFREQPTERRTKLARWIHASQPIQRDMIAFAVEFVLAHAAKGDFMNVEYALKNMCAPRPDKEAQPEQPEESLHRRSQEQVRGWMREFLSEQKVLADLFEISTFDRLAEMAELPAGERIQRLRQALTMDTSSTHDDGGHLQYLQGDAALRLVELGERSEVIPRILEATVHLLAESNEIEAFQFAYALKPLSSPNAALRNSLVGIMLRVTWGTIRGPVLDLLEWVGLTEEDRIELLTTRLKRKAQEHEVIDLLDALANLNCPREQREALILEYVATRQEPLSSHILLALMGRVEISIATEARLMLAALAQAQGFDMEQVLRHWVQRFASQVSLTDDDRWWSYATSDYLLSRQRTMASLAKVDDPALVDRALAELATPHASELLALYRPARTGEALSTDRWRELMALLAVKPEDPNAMHFAKEWLLLGLWKTLEPEPINRWFAS